MSQHRRSAVLHICVRRDFAACAIYSKITTLASLLSATFVLVIANETIEIPIAVRSAILVTGNLHDFRLETFNECFYRIEWPERQSRSPKKINICRTLHHHGPLTNVSKCRASICMIYLLTCFASLPVILLHDIDRLTEQSSQ